MSKMYYRPCSNEQFMKKATKNKTIFFNNWRSTGRLNDHLAKSLLTNTSLKWSTYFIIAEVACCRRNVVIVGRDSTLYVNCPLSWVKLS